MILLKCSILIQISGFREIFYLKADKMSMAHCLESRVPFLDVKVFDYAKKLTN